MAWLSNQIDHTLPILNDGKNLIPTIHINDFVSLIKRIIEKTPDAVYIIAVDKTKDRSLKNIITSISKSVGNSKVQHHHSNLTTIPNSHKMSIDLKMRSTKLFEDKQEEGEEEEDFNKRKFKWHCEVFFLLSKVWNP
jgi:nucleoside-diphosphate-sugar epimerase